MSDECAAYFAELIGCGVERSLAVDRVFDCFDLAIDPGGKQLVFKADQPLLDRLVKIRESEVDMRSMNWQRPTTIGDGEFKQLAPGGYVARIVSAQDHEDKEYFELVYDIAEGPNAGFYSDAWGVEHPYAHRIVMSYKPKAQNMLEGRLNAIDASNPGFDSRAALDVNRFDMFVGRIIGINLQEEEYEKNDGSVGVRLNVCQVTSAQDVRDGKVNVRDKKPIKTSAPQPSQGQIDMAYAQSVAVPFA